MFLTQRGGRYQGGLGSGIQEGLLEEKGQEWEVGEGLNRY